MRTDASASARLRIERPIGSAAEALAPARPGAADLDAWTRYRDNLARHLIGIARDLQHRLMAHLVGERGHRDLRPSFGVLISQIARAPRSIAVLARELGISVQATSQLVGLAEQAGYLKRREGEPAERARQIVLSEAGERLVADAVAQLRALEADQARQAGERDYPLFLAALAALATRAAPLDRAPAALFATPQATAGLLPLLATRVERHLMDAMSRRGHAGLKLSHSQILTLIGPSGVRLHRLAELHRVSRQAISAVARDLETLGYVAREADPADRRGVVVRLTPRGHDLIADSVGAADALENEWRGLLAPERFEALVRVAGRLYAALALETEILMDAFTTVPRRDELARLASRLRDHLGERDAARLAAHLSADA